MHLFSKEPKEVKSLDQSPKDSMATRGGYKLNKLLSIAENLGNGAPAK